MTSTAFPPPQSVPIFPAGPGVLHGSGVLTPSGTFLYVYADAEGFHEARYVRGIVGLRDATAGTAGSGPSLVTWREGQPDSRTQIFGCSLGAICVWRRDGRLLATVSFRLPGQAEDGSDLNKLQLCREGRRGVLRSWLGRHVVAVSVLGFGGVHYER